MRRNLTKSEIIRLKRDIDRIFKAGNRKSFSCFKVYAVKNNLPYSRFIVIPVRHYGNSVQRNHIRRQVKEIWRNNKQEIPKGLDFAIIVFENQLAYKEKEKNLLMLIEKLSIKTFLEQIIKD